LNRRLKHYDVIIEVDVLGEGRRAGCKKTKRNTCLERIAVFSSAGKRAPGPRGFSCPLSWTTHG